MIAATIRPTQVLRHTFVSLLSAHGVPVEASLEEERRLELRLAGAERRLPVDSTDSGTPSSRERIGAKEARQARRQSERERTRDRKRGGQPGHQEKAWRGIRIWVRRKTRHRRRRPIVPRTSGRLALIQGQTPGDC